MLRSPCRYDFDKVHEGTKHFGTNIDKFTWGMDSFALLLFFGDLKVARVGFDKVNDSHRRMLAKVQQGVTTADKCALPTQTAHHRAVTDSIGGARMARTVTAPSSPVRCIMPMPCFSLETSTDSATSLRTIVAWQARP